MGVFVGAVEAGAGRGELEAVDGEGEVVVVRVVDEEAVVRVLLQALGVVALGDERARVAGVRALLDARRLAMSFGQIVISDILKRINLLKGQGGLVVCLVRVDVILGSKNCQILPRLMLMRLGHVSGHGVTPKSISTQPRSTTR